jgi:molecular chaperone DnaK (HSP70)
LANRKNEKEFKMSIVKKQSPYFVGIDLGTSNSSLSVCHRGDPRTIPLNGQKTIPSVIQFKNKKKDRMVVGANAKKYKLVNPDEVFSSIKPLMKNEEWRNEQDLVDKFTIEGDLFSPTDIAAAILREMIARANEQEDFDLKGTIRQAVICVQANTTDEYRNNVYKAAALAGLGEVDESGNVILDDEGRPKGVRILEEPTAAAIAYGHELGIFKERKKQTILVYDLGGGTFDVTILDIDSSADGTPTFSVRNTKGVAKLGGDDFDKVLMDICAEAFKEETQIDIFDLKSDVGIAPKALKQAQQKLKEKCEEAKIAMAQGTSRVDIEDAAFLVDESGKQLNLNVQIKKTDFLGKLQPLLDQAKNCVQEALQEKDMSIEDISRVILVGGSTKADWVVESIKSLYPSGEEREPFNAKDVDVIVSQGAALFGASQTTPISEEERVAIDVESIVSHHLGIELRNQVFSPILEKGLPLTEEVPVQLGTRPYGNQENQDTIQIVVWKTQKNIEFVEENGQRKPVEPVYVNERDDQDNRLFECIGEFTLKGIPKGPEGSEQIEVTMELNRENLLKVSSKVLSSGNTGELELSVDKS